MAVLSFAKGDSWEWRAVVPPISNRAMLRVCAAGWDAVLSAEHSYLCMSATFLWELCS